MEGKSFGIAQIKNELNKKKILTKDELKAKINLYDSIPAPPTEAEIEQLERIYEKDRLEEVYERMA